MAKVSIPTLIVALLMIFILLTFAFTYQVDFYESAVEVRLGRADDESVINADGQDPGLKLRWPWPVESIETYDMRLRTLDTPETEVKTIDGKNLIVGTYAVWRIADPLQFFNRVKTVARAENQMRSRLSQVQAAVIGRKSLPYFVNLDRELVDANYAELLDEMRAGVAEGLRRDYGIHVHEVGIRRISLPSEVTKDVFESMIQDRRTLAARYREEGKSRAEAIKARARADAKQILAFADRKAQEIRSAGIQASTRILARIDEADREFFEWLRWLDALQAALSQRTTIFIDQDWPFFDPFVNPPVSANPSDSVRSLESASDAVEVQETGTSVPADE